MNTIKEVSEFPDYNVSTDGIVRCCVTNAIIRPFIYSYDGSLCVHLKNREGKLVRRSVAILVARAYLPTNTKKHQVVGFHDHDRHNVSIKNIYWIDTSQQQRQKFHEARLQAKVKYGVPEKFSPEDGLFPNPRPCPGFPDYFHVPQDEVVTPIIINREGHCINLVSGKTIKSHQDAKGYWKTTIVNGHGHSPFSTNPPIHRILAMLFVGRPSRHRNIPFEELEVNHINGIKNDFRLENLEWVSRSENDRHARVTGLFTNAKPVLARYSTTGAVIRYYGIAECAREHGLGFTSLRNHLNSPFVGKIQRKGWCFKFDDGLAWPSVEIDVEDSRLGCTMAIFAIDPHTGKYHVFADIHALAEFLNVGYSHIKNHRARYSTDKPFMGWIIKQYRELFEEE